MTKVPLTWGQRLAEQLDLAGVVLIIMLTGMFVLFWLAQRGGPEGFDLRRMLLDDNDKPSVLRVLSVGAWAVSSWVVMRDAITVEGADVPLLAVYLAAWSLSPVAVKLIEALQAKWSK